MKKLSVLLVTLGLVFALSACGFSTNSNNNGGRQQSSDGNITESQPNESNSQPQLQNPAPNGVQNQSNADSQQPTQNTDRLISRDEAIDIALKQAGVTKENARDLEAELDRERSIVVWEVDFESGNTEYSYDVNAETGAITERGREFND